MYEQPITAPDHKSKLANIFGAHFPQQDTTPLGAGFIATGNGSTLMTPRAAVPGLAISLGSYRHAHANVNVPQPPPHLAPYSASPRASPRSGYSSNGAVNMALSPRGFFSQQDKGKTAAIALSQHRIDVRARHEKMRHLMQHISNRKDEVPVSDLLLSAELAEVPLREDQKELFFKTPVASRFASTWEPNTPRSSYGLECIPRSVKWRAFDQALRHARMQDPADVEAALRFYAAKEQQAIADAKIRDEEANALAKARADALGKDKIEPIRGISDDQLRQVHTLVKQRLSTQFGEIRKAFREFDKDKSGNISAKECTDALLSLNVNLPRKWLDHLVNVADYDRDGEINYKEFARILTVDDITKIKKDGVEDEGLVDLSHKDVYKPGITRSEMRAAQGKIRDMLLERGGLTKMFRSIDEDKSGTASRKEMRMLIRKLNLETVIRPHIIEELIDLMDCDKDEQITMAEFSRVITAEDVFDMKEHRAPTRIEAQKRLSKKQKELIAKRAVGLK